MNKKIFLLTTLLLSTSYLTSCGGNPSDPDKPDPDPDPPISDTRTITFKLYDKEVKKEFKIGETPKFDGEVPLVYDEGFETGHKFTNWDRELAPVSEDTTYTAIYEPIKTVISIMIKLSPNCGTNLSFKCEGDLKKVSWGDGYTDENDQENQKHTYAVDFINSSKFINVRVCGDISSFSVSDSEIKTGQLNYKIDAIEFSDTITNIKSNAFDGLAIRSVLLTKNIVDIGEKAFNDYGSNTCTFYTQPGINTERWSETWRKEKDRVVENIVDIGFEMYANNYFGYLVNYDSVDKNNYLYICSFYKCDDSNDITIPSKISDKYNVDGLIYSPFKGISGINSVTLPDSLYYIGESAFDQIGISDLNIPKSVQKIGYKAFEHSNIKNFYFDEENNSSLNYIGDYAFTYCNNVESIKLPSNVLEIGEGAFSFCNSIRNVDFSITKITALKAYTFQNSTSLIIKLPDTLKQINKSAVYNSTSPTVELPNTNTVDEIPVCEADSFKTTGTTVLTVKYNSELGDDPSSVKELFTDKGWPDNATYEPLQ